MIKRLNPLSRFLHVAEYYSKEHISEITYCIDDEKLRVYSTFIRDEIKT